MDSYKEFAYTMDHELWWSALSRPKICHGQPVFKGTRVLVSSILDALAAGSSIKELIKEYPILKKNDILAAIEYASKVLKGEEHSLKRAV